MGKIDYSGFAFAKPNQDVVRKTAAERSELRKELFRRNNRCTACGCIMTLELGLMNTATLEHEQPGKMGERKNDSPENLNRLTCWKCNFHKGSKRNWQHKEQRDELAFGKPK